MQPTVYIPNLNRADHLRTALQSLGGGDQSFTVVVVDNGSSDGSPEMVRDEFPAVALIALGENLGFGAALNRAVAAHPAEAAILFNNDAAAEPRFVEALLDGLGAGVDAVAGVLTQEGDPGLIDSAGVVADRVAQKLGVPCFETPTGWKFFGNLLDAGGTSHRASYPPP